MSKRILMLAAAVLLAAIPARAEEGLITFKSMTLETATKAAMGAVESCRAGGFQVTVAVVDRGGNLQVLLRDRYAGPLTPETAKSKARTAVSFRTDTIELVDATAAGTPQSGARHIPGVVMLGGGVVIEAAGTIVGGIGVSGAPSGRNDDACARQGIEAVADVLAF